MKRRTLTFLCMITLLFGSTPLLHAHGGHTEKQTTDGTCNDADFYCPVVSSDELEHALEDLATPTTAPPSGMIASVQVSVSKPVTRTVSYEVTTKGAVTANFAEFTQQAQQTFDDARGWKRLGVRFVQVATGGEFTLVLSEASQVPSFGQICSSEYSCNVGRYVIINQDRWQGGTSAWNNAGGGLRDYRHMVVNHETGHWLGHGHNSCAAAGQAAAVMQQQSISLQGCKFNPWPLDSEIWSTRLGI